MRHVENPPNPYDRFSSEVIGEPPPTKLEIYEETVTKKMITKSWSPDFGHRFIVNCYRGCIHGCTYCFARRYHEYIGYGAGTDFETKIVAKVNAPEVLRSEIRSSRKPLPFLEFSFATDPYIPIEANYKLTRDCLKVAKEFGIPVRILTKSPLVTRDLDLLSEMDASVGFSIPFLDLNSSKPFEPFAPRPEARFRALEEVSSRGIRTMLALAPVIPGYNDAEIPSIMKKARECGAQTAFMSMIHIDSDSIQEFFLSKLREKAPTKAAKIVTQISREKSGTLRHRNYDERNSGKTKKWEMTKKVFELNFEKLGFRKHERLFDEVEKVITETQPSLF